MKAIIGEPAFFNEKATLIGNISKGEYENQGIHKSLVAYKILAEYPLESAPVFDGMIAIEGKLFSNRSRYKYADFEPLWTI